MPSPPPRSTRGEAGYPDQRPQSRPALGPCVPVPHHMNPDLDDMDAPPRAANLAVKRADSIWSRVPGGPHHALLRARGWRCRRSSGPELELYPAGLVIDAGRTICSRSPKSTTSKVLSPAPAFTWSRKSTLACGPASGACCCARPGEVRYTVCCLWPPVAPGRVPIRGSGARAALRPLIANARSCRNEGVAGSYIYALACIATV